VVKIKKGDRVNVHFAWTKLINLEVRHVPKEIGEDWILQDDTGRIVYVKNYEYIEQLK